MIGFFKARSKRSVSAKINKEISESIGRIAKQIANRRRNEEETRRWVIDMMRAAFGYKDDDITAELSVLGKRVDVALLYKESVIAVIECKAASVQLNSAAVNQVANYAIALHAEWAILTNGNRWMLLHVTPRKGFEPGILQIFDIEILDDDGLSKSDVDDLYLISKQAIISGETKASFHQENILSEDRLKDAITSPDIVSAIAEKLKASYKIEHGVSVDADKDLLREVLEAAIDEFENSI